MTVSINDTKGHQPNSHNLTQGMKVGGEGGASRLNTLSAALHLLEVENTNNTLTSNILMMPYSNVYINNALNGGGSSSQLNNANLNNSLSTNSHHLDPSLTSVATFPTTTNINDGDEYESYGDKAKKKYYAKGNVVSCQEPGCCYSTTRAYLLKTHLKYHQEMYVGSKPAAHVCPHPKCGYIAR